jgi:hypothetical protein
MAILARFKAAQSTGFRKPLPTVAKIAATFDFNPSTGELIRKSNGRTMKSQNTNGYYVVRVDGDSFTAHRIIWKLLYGYDPTADIDHIDGVKTNNRPSNLRLASAAQNSVNRKGTGASGYRGVSFSRGRWHAAMRVNGKRFYLGASHCLEDAAALYREAAQKVHGDFCHRSVTEKVTE